MKLDPAVLDLLSLDDSTTTVSSHGGGGCSSASTLKITSKDVNGRQKHFFMKTGTGKDAEIMFQGEHHSLNALSTAVSSLCPHSYGFGQYTSSPGTFFLVTSFLNLSPRQRTPHKTIPSLAQKLAQLHSTPAPVPQGYTSPMFGFSVPTCCGDTPQDNTYTASWAEFYAERRLRFILRRAEAANGVDKELHSLVETTATRVVPRLLADDHLNHGKGITPVVVHGDLWSGNTSRGSFSGSEERDGEEEVVHEVVYDASACYAHSEYELGIMKMFGGFGADFLREYHRYCEKSEPVGEYEDRVALYELYHHLNHYALFGGGYKSGAASIMRQLIKKYAPD